MTAGSIMLLLIHATLPLELLYSFLRHLRRRTGLTGQSWTAGVGLLKRRAAPETRRWLVHGRPARCNRSIAAGAATKLARTATITLDEWPSAGLTGGADHAGTLATDT